MRGPALYLIILVLVILIARMFGAGSTLPAEPLSYEPDFLNAVRDEKIEEVIISENNLIGIYKDSKVKNFPSSYDFKVYLPSVEQLRQDVAAIRGKSVDEITAADYGFKVTYEPPAETPWWVSMIPFFIVIVILVVFWYFFMQQAQGGGNKMMSFGKSRARVNEDGKNKVTFDRVAGADEEKEELKEVVDFLKDPKKFTALGARIPKGVLLVGPPGTGKTLLAKAAAGEAGVPFFSISGSDFVEMFVGVGASRVRDLFENAKKHSPCIVFIDEIDAVGRHRGSGLGGGHDEREQTLNQLLVEMDGFAVNEGIIILAATNRPDILDPALLRPGRFDRQVIVGRPDVKGRLDIMKVYAKDKPLEEDVDLKVLAKRTPGFTGADIENMMNEAAILTARANKKKISMPELEEAITRVIAGPEKKSRLITPKDKRLVAYHEAGHAIVAAKLPNCDPVHEVSIVPRGMAGGYTMTLPKEDTNFVTRGKLLDHIAEFMGGRVAEALVLDDISTGASNDIQRASEIARDMVTQYGMSDTLGPVYLGGGEEIFLGKEIGHSNNYSEEIAARVDKEVHAILETGYRRAETILKENMDKLHEVVGILLDQEKLDGQEFAKIMGIEPPPDPTAPDSNDDAPGPSAPEAFATA
nr:ATP-dependent zinc metalloprotease FtsH [Gehongia tenuis]